MTTNYLSALDKQEENANISKLISIINGDAITTHTHTHEMPVKPDRLTMSWLWCIPASFLTIGGSYHFVFGWVWIFGKAYKADKAKERAQVWKDALRIKNAHLMEVSTERMDEITESITIDSTKNESGYSYESPLRSMVIKAMDVCPEIKRAAKNYNDKVIAISDSEESSTTVLFFE